VKLVYELPAIEQDSVPEVDEIQDRLESSDKKSREEALREAPHHGKH